MNLLLYKQTHDHQDQHVLTHPSPTDALPIFYRPVNDRIVLAARARFGTILGSMVDRIAPSRRFYAGGGASVRGYGYQAIGPRYGPGDDPVGGKSLAEFSLESRIRFGDRPEEHTSELRSLMRISYSVF